MEFDVLRKMTKKIAEIQVKHPLAVLAAVIIFTIIILPGMGLLYFDTSNENFLPENDPVVESLFIVGSDFGGFSTLNILFFIEKEGIEETIDLRDPKFLKRVELLGQTLQELEYVETVITPIQEIKRANNGVLPDDLEAVKRIISQNPEIARFYTKDFSFLRINILAATLGEDDVSQQRNYGEILSHISSVSLPSGVTARPWGSLVQFIELNQNLGSDLGFTTMLAFLSIFVLIVIFYRSIVSGFLAIMPIAIALVWTVGTMGYINLPFTMLTSGFIPLVMGLGIDFSIHLIHGIKHLQSEGKKIEDAILETMEEVGEAITASTITTGIGFFSLVLATLLVTQRLGMTLTLSVLFIYIGCIVIIPPVLLLQENLFNKSQGKNSFRRRKK